MPNFARVRSSVRAALGSVAPVVLRAVRQPSLTVLMYHRVLPRAHPAVTSEQPGMWVSPETLRLHASVLREFFEPVFLDDWLESARRGEALPPRAVALTFDDGWRDNFTFGFPVLQDCRLPATVFLVTARIGGEYLFWPTRLARLLRDHWSGEREGRFAAPIANLVAVPHRPTDPGAAADAVIEACKRYSDDEMDAAVTESERLSSRRGADERSLLDATEIRAMVDSGLVRFGSHTRTHARFSAALSPARIQAEVAASRSEVEMLTGRAAPLFCYPNGDVTAQALAVVRDTYAGAVTTKPGWNDRRSDPHLLRRLGLHEGMSASRVALLWHVVRSAFE
jgi:peptidoglycan/xylan/chitin deacetylase (PgdA/CDA1 family)